MLKGTTGGRAEKGEKMGEVERERRGGQEKKGRMEDFYHKNPALCALGMAHIRATRIK